MYNNMTVLFFCQDPKGSCFGMVFGIILLSFLGGGGVNNLRLLFW